VLPVRGVFFYGGVLFLALCEYCVKKSGFCSCVVIFLVLVLLMRLQYVELVNGVHMFPFVCDV